MAFQMGDDDSGGMNEMNLIPLIDIMLVLMIIFLVTATVMKPSIPLTLPKTSATVQDNKQQVLQISIDKNNQLFIDKKPISMAELKTQLTKAKNQADAKNIPSINIRADKDSNYDAIAKVMATASKTGLTDIAFVSDANNTK